MKQRVGLFRQGLRTPRAAAIAGIIFSLLMITSMMLIRTSIPANPLEGAKDIVNHSRRIALALNLMPFAGISFLWFVGVLRDRLGELEDRFFSTVFFGSALLFLAMIFITGTLAGGIIRLLGSGFVNLTESGVYILGRIQIYQALHIYAIKMAGVFMISTSVISVRTGIVPRWMAFLGFTLALMLLLAVQIVEWMLMVFPLWVLSISVYILIDNFRGISATAGASAVAKE